MARAGSGHRDSGPPARRLAEPPAGSVTHIWLDLRRREGTVKDDFDTLIDEFAEVDPSVGHRVTAALVSRTPVGLRTAA